MSIDAPTWTEVNRLFLELQREYEGLHKRINEVEQLRYLEDPIALAPQEKQSGLEIRVGLTAELVENVKSAITTNPARVAFRPLRSGTEAQANSSTRELFWNAFLKWVNTPTPVLNELADAQVGLGVGILKASYYPWPKEERRRKKGEGQDDYLDRLKGLKRKWGPYFRAISPHPLTYFFRPGAGNKIAESVEQGWKPRRQVCVDYSLPLESTNISMQDLAASIGQPIEYIRPLPYGTSTETLALVTEYWSPEWYQVYINSALVYEEENPKVRYFMAVGRSSSSRDPDKFGLSVAEILRQNEPILNRTLTRMAEAAELVVRKRLTVVLPEGAIAPEGLDESGNPVTKTWVFKPGEVEALPAGAQLKDVFEGAENVYQAMPFVDLMLRLTAQHGVSPLFKGIPPGAAGSGYRDNSLYLMAKSQFQYLLDSYSNCLTEFINWLEEQVVSIGEEVFVENVSLKPSEIKDWPCAVEVSIEPLLPQNIIAEGQFWDRMHSRGHVTRRHVIEKGLREEQPEKMITDRMFEDLQDMLKPILFQDVLRTVGLIKEVPVAPGGDGESPQVTQPGGPGGAQMLLAGKKAPSAEGESQGEAGLSMGGYTRAGQSRQPPEEAGATPGLKERQ